MSFLYQNLTLLSSSGIVRDSMTLFSSISPLGLIKVQRWGTGRPCFTSLIEIDKYRGGNKYSHHEHLCYKVQTTIFTPSNRFQSPLLRYYYMTASYCTSTSTHSCSGSRGRTTGCPSRVSSRVRTMNQINEIVN